jgi:hypothetical protein
MTLFPTGKRGDGDVDGFERAKLFQILDGEDLKRMPRHDGTDDEGDCDGDAEVDRYARVAR